MRNVSYIARGRVRTDVGGCGDLTRRDPDRRKHRREMERRREIDVKPPVVKKVEWSFDCLHTSK